MKQLILTWLLLIGASVVSGQNANDSILIRKVFLGTDFMQNGKHLNNRQLLDITKSNTEAYRQMKIAKRNYTTWSIIAGASSVLILWPIFSKPPDQDINWIPVAVGAGVFIISIPFGYSYTNHTKKAVYIFNSGIRNSSPTNPSFNICLTGNGLGIRVKF